MPKNYYSILGVSEQASQEEVRKAFRELAHIHHPDRGGREKTFKEITEAYHVLGNEGRRRSYDSERRGAPASAAEAAKTAQKKEPEESRAGMGAQFAAVIVVAFLIGLSLLSIGGDEDVPVPDPTASGTAIPLPASAELIRESFDEKETISIGSSGVSSVKKPVNFSGTVIESLGPVLTASYGYFDPPKRTGGNFLKVRFNAMSGGEDLESMRIESVRLLDGDGYVKGLSPLQVYHCDDQYSSTRAYRMAHAAIKESEYSALLKPGIPCEWTMIFEVPPGEDRYQLEFILR